MMFALFHNLENLTYYGRVPNPPLKTTSQVEIYRMKADSDRDLLDDDLVDSVNALCGSLLGPYDVDFLDVRQCRLLAAWLETRLAQPIPPRLTTIYSKLNDFARRAVQYGTGVVIEL